MLWLIELPSTVITSLRGLSVTTLILSVFYEGGCLLRPTSLIASELESLELLVSGVNVVVRKSTAESCRRYVTPVHVNHFQYSSVAWVEVTFKSFLRWQMGSGLGEEIVCRSIKSKANKLSHLSTLQYSSS